MRQNVGRNATSSSPYIKTFWECYFVDISVSFKEKQHHFKLHPHMGQKIRNLAKVPYWQCTCPSPSAHLLGIFGHGSTSVPSAQSSNYDKIRLLTLGVKFDGIWRRTPELEHLPWTAFIRCIWNILFPIKAPFAEKTALLIFAFFVCFLPQNQFQCIS